MRIGVVSDTHSLEIPRQLLDDFKKTDMVIHAGDICMLEDLDLLGGLKKVKGVCGNMDGAEIRRRLPRRQILQVEGVSIGICHGQGAPERVLDVVGAEFKADQVDAIVFGHTHQPFNKVVDHILFFNPGSPSDLVFAPYRSYGILEVCSGEIKGEIIKIR